MVDVDMITAIVQGDTVAVWDMWSTQFDRPSSDSDISGCHSNVFRDDSSMTSDGFTVTMNRKLNTNDPSCDWVINLNAPTPLVFAYLDRGGEQFNQHQYAGSGTLVIGATAATSSWVGAGGASYSDNFKTHGIMMGHSWMAVMLVSVVAARYFKHYWLWYWIHLLGGLYTTIITVIYSIYAYEKDKPEWTGTFAQWLFHSRCGFFIVGFVPGQAVLGLLTRYLTWKGRSIQALSTVRRAHYITGWVLMGTSLAAVYYGLQCFHKSEVDNLKWAFSLYCLILIGFETWRWVMCYWNPRKEIPGVEKTSWVDVYQNVKRGKKLVFLDTHILDISSFIDSHPGGSYLLADSIGEDYGKYIYGVNGLEATHTGFAHPSFVWTFVSLMKVGEVGYHLGVVHKNSGPPDLHNMRWTLASKTPMAPNVSRFAFVSDEMFINHAPKGLDWIGTHFRVTADFAMGQRVHRYYSLCLFFNQENMQRWVESAQKQGLQVSLAAGRRPSATLPTLDIVVKEYAPHGKMSTLIHRLEPGDALTFTGPMGPGLILTPTLQGHFCAFGAGTGIMPFIDLVDFLYWKELYSRGEEKDQKYSALEDFTVTLYASFQKEQDVIGGDLMKCTHALCQQVKSSRFELVLMISTEFKGNLEDVVAGMLSAKPVKRVWTCGPSGFNRWICKLSLKAGIKRENILVM